MEQNSDTNTPEPFLVKSKWQNVLNLKKNKDIIVKEAKKCLMVLMKNSKY